MADFKLPDLGEGVTEAEVDKWLVKEGQEIAEDELLVEVITDKATAEIPSPFSGVVARIHVAEGTIVPVGTVLVTIGGADESPEASANPEKAGIEDAPTDKEAATVTAGAEDGVKATPPVRKLARELDIDLSEVTGTGPGGRISREDVEAVAGSASEEASPAGGRRVPLRGVRRKIAEHMLKAHLAIPSVTHVEECDITEVDAARKLANERDAEGTKLTFLPFIVRAVSIELKKFPPLNSSLDETAGEIVYHEHYNIGIAVDAPQGLMVPVIRNADKLSLRELATEIERLASGAKDGTLKAEELRGSTFSVTSPGRFGGLMATPLVNHPNSAILGVHRATERPVVRDGQVVVRLMMNLSITFDHRIMDGVTASSFCMGVVDLLEHPTELAL
jgi:pyruvate/2-oxoglutarate dehydrogenase complex dihydrolipoamide acyltransferase (E2) component